MTVLLDLPSEVITLIFCNLRDIDDVNHLSRSCRRLHSILQNEATYLIVMRTIIVSFGITNNLKLDGVSCPYLQSQSDVYENDLALCTIIETNQAFSEFYQTHAERPLESGIKGSDLPNLAHERPEELTAERVYTIICRWHGLRVLQELYLDVTIGTQYYESTFPFAGDFDPADMTLSTESSVRVSHLQSLPAGDNAGKSFDAQQTQRFYKALTSYWLAMEAHWLLCRSVQDTWEELWNLSDSVEDIWSGNLRGGLLESLEVLEVYDFVYGFLLRMIFPNVETTLPWLSGSGSYYFENNTFAPSEWVFFLQNCRLFLRPPDIIELLAMVCSSTETTWPTNKSEYLQQRGAFDFLGGTALTDHPDGDTLDFWFDVGLLEEGVCRQIQICAPLDDAQQLQALWRRFRDGWKCEARWKLFWWTDSSDDIVARIQNQGGE
jgi:F-box domain